MQATNNICKLQMIPPHLYSPHISTTINTTSEHSVNRQLSPTRQWYYYGITRDLPRETRVQPRVWSLFYYASYSVAVQTLGAKRSRGSGWASSSWVGRLWGFASQVSRGTLVSLGGTRVINWWILGDTMDFQSELSFYTEGLGCL